MSTRASDASLHRINVNVSEEVYEALQQIAADKGKSMSDVIRDAIALEKWAHQEKKQGNRILVERDGRVREVLLR